MDGLELSLRRLVRLVASAALAVAILAGPALALGARHAGWQPLVERTGSMAPAITPGDLVLVDRGPADRVRTGDVITFADPHVRGRTITHRVVAIRRRGSLLRVVTKGDANRAPETWTIPASGTVGRLRATVALPSAVTKVLDRSHERGIVMLLLAAMACSLTLRAIWRRPAVVAPCAPVR